MKILCVTGCYITTMVLYSAILISVGVYLAYPYKEITSSQKSYGDPTHQDNVWPIEAIPTYPYPTDPSFPTSPYPSIHPSVDCDCTASTAGSGERIEQVMEEEEEGQGEKKGEIQNISEEKQGQIQNISEEKKVEDEEEKETVNVKDKQEKQEDEKEKQEDEKEKQEGEKKEEDEDEEDIYNIFSDLLVY